MDIIPFWVKIIGIGIVFAGLWGGGYLKGEHRWKGKYDGLVAQIKVERDDWNTKITGINKSNQDAARLAAEGAHQQLDAAHSERDSFAQQLRLERANRPALRPSNDSPVECKQYEATPDLLPEGDRRLLGWAGELFDEIVSQRNECFARFEAARGVKP